MQARKILSMILALALVISVIAPCSNVVHANQPKITLYGDNLEQVTAPVIGESYYLGADVDGTMMYFRHGTVSDTVPYSLVATDNFNHNWTFKLTVEDPSAISDTTVTTGFQLTYTHPTLDGNPTARIYCMDVLKDATVAGQTGIMDTGANTTVAYKNRHNFYIQDLDGVKLLTSTGNSNVLVIKQVPQTTSGNTADAWRMLFVPVDELANEGVYPVMMLKEHTHAFGNPTITGDVATRTCTTCGHTETVYGQTLQQVTDPTIGETYYLAANQNGTMYYYVTGDVGGTAPYSLKTSTNSGSTQQVTIEDPSEVTGGDGTGFQMTYYTTKTIRIYCYDALKDSTTAGQTGIMDTGASAPTSAANATFYVDDVNGVKVLRKTGNDHVLVLKYNDTKSAWRMLGVPETELTNGDVYPVMLLKEHTHDYTSGKPQGDDTNHTEACWCGAKGTKTEAHTYGKSIHNTATKTTTRTCTVCGYTAAIHGHSQAQVKYPTIGETYNLVVNVNGQILSFTTGGYTQTTPQSLITSTDVKVVKVQEALEAGKGEFQLVYNNGTDDYSVYSIAAGPGLSKSASYVSDPMKVSFLMDEVNGVKVLRAYGTGKILAAKYSDAKAAWRIFPVEDSEIGTEGVFPVMLTTAHTQHTYETEWTFDKENGTQSHLCAECGHPKDTLYGTELKATQVTEPVIGNSYYLAANVNGKLMTFTSGGVTETDPYSLRTAMLSNKSIQVTMEAAVAEGKGEFQMTFPSTDSNGNPITARIYCYDVSSDSDYDTGTNSNNGANFHTFSIDEVNGVKILRKYYNNRVLVVKQIPVTIDGVTTNQWRMQGVLEAELANEGVYPVMLMDLHEHSFGEKQFSNDEGHYTLCDCETKNLIPHSFGQWTLDRAAQTQTATCSVCDHTVTVRSPYFDTVDSLEELENSLAETVLDEETNTYTVTGGKDFYLMAEIGDDFYYFRNGGSGENTSSTVSETTGHSLYTTNDPSHDNIIKAKVIPGNTENTYIIHAGKAINRVVYIRDESADGIMDTGMTAFKEASTLTTSALATYKARSEFIWDEENGRLYQQEGDVKYVLVMKQMDATYGDQTVTEWRVVGVPEAEAEAAGNYPVVLANHVHNLSKTFQNDGSTYYRACGCGYKATVDAGIVLGERIGLNFNVKLEEGETITATVAGEEATVEQTEKGVFIPLAAAQMTDEVKLTVGGDALDVAFTVNAEAAKILADESYNQYAKDLVNHMLAYGGAAQSKFDYNTDTLAGDLMEVTVPTSPAGVEVHEDLEGVEYYGASLVHDSTTAVRFYFKTASVEGLTFTVDGNVYEPAQKDDMYYIEVTGIDPQNLDKDMNVVVTKGEQNLAVSYSPLNYIVRTYNRDASEELKDLVKAMYGYHKAAKTYIANKYLGTGFTLKEQTVTSLYEGVDQYASTYVATDVGEVEAYAIVVSADANVELKVSAGAWGADSTAENPGETKTVANHFRAMKNAGSNVLAMINGGFFDLNKTKTMKPYGMQIVDGVVKQAPAAGNYSDTWFGMTKDGKYVISDAAGYESTYMNNVQQGVGGGKLLIVGGQVQDIISTRDYRTAVGVNANGDLVLVAVESATYSDVCQIFVDLGLDIVTVLNLDGGGSTAMYVPGAFYPKALILGEDGLLPREVADAVGIVVK